MIVNVKFSIFSIRKHRKSCNNVITCIRLNILAIRYLKAIFISLNFLNYRKRCIFLFI